MIDPLTTAQIAEPPAAEEAQPAPEPDKLPSGRLHFRTLRVGAGLTRTIFDMNRDAFGAFAEQAHVGAHAPATHTPEPRPVGGVTGRARSGRR